MRTEGFLQHDTFYVKVGDDAIGGKHQELISVEDQWFEMVTSPERLMHLTQGKIVQEVTFDLAYESLKGGQLEQSFVKKLPRPLIIYDTIFQVDTSPYLLRTDSLISSIHPIIQPDKSIVRIADRAYQVFGGTAQTDPSGNKYD